MLLAFVFHYLVFIRCELSVATDWNLTQEWLTTWYEPLSCVIVNVSIIRTLVKIVLQFNNSIWFFSYYTLCYLCFNHTTSRMMQILWSCIVGHLVTNIFTFVRQRSGSNYCHVITIAPKRLTNKNSFTKERPMSSTKRGISLVSYKYGPEHNMITQLLYGMKCWQWKMGVENGIA